MHGFLTSSAGACLAALALPLTVTVPLAHPAEAHLLPSSALAAGAARPLPGGAPSLVGDSPSPPGRTRSLPLAPLAADRALGSRAAQGLTRRQVSPFALLGVVWDDPDVELHGRAQVRTRATGTGVWSRWRDIGVHSREHAPDPGSAEGAARRVRGATAPLWVGWSDGVEVRVIPAAHEGAARGDTAPRGAASVLPRGLRLELVDPGARAGLGGEAASGAAPHTGTAHRPRPPHTASAADARPTPAGPAVVAAQDRAGTQSDLVAAGGGPYIGARPAIVTRAGWGADESLREGGFVYTGPVRAAFVHHTDSGNDYTCAEAPEVIRGIYRFHVVSQGWRDIGYNFLIDRCGTLYEGRAGGVDKPVKGAHTMGFNNDSTGVAVIGTFTHDEPPRAAVDAVAELTAWKLGLSGADPQGTTELTSQGGNRYPKGQNAQLNVVSGHRDGYDTDCPGTRLYDQLGAVRTTAAQLQGR